MLSISVDAENEEQPVARLIYQELFDALDVFRISYGFDLHKFLQSGFYFLEDQKRILKTAGPRAWTWGLPLTPCDPLDSSAF